MNGWLLLWLIAASLIAGWGVAALLVVVVQQLWGRHR